jgi:hypothetical protein
MRVVTVIYAKVNDAVIDCAKGGSHLCSYLHTLTKRTNFNARTLFLNLFLNVLREASPLAAFRRKRTCFEKSASSRRKGVLPKEGRPSGSFTSGGFLREASPLALPEGREQVRFPSEIRNCQGLPPFLFKTYVPRFPKEAKDALPEGSELLSESSRGRPSRRKGRSPKKAHQ